MAATEADCVAPEREQVWVHRRTGRAAQILSVAGGSLNLVEYRYLDSSGPALMHKPTFETRFKFFALQLGFI